jgi:hypothetical protein
MAQRQLPYSWAGYYLKSPCHQDDGWMGKRETLTDIGYGLAVLYVGQQTWGRRPGRAAHRARQGVEARHVVRRSEGRIAARSGAR